VSAAADRIGVKIEITKLRQCLGRLEDRFAVAAVDEAGLLNMKKGLRSAQELVSEVSGVMNRAAAGGGK
jgi:hypothetical protein